MNMQKIFLLIIGGIVLIACTIGGLWRSSRKRRACK